MQFNQTKYICFLVDTQESCARVLLFRGANKEVKNYNSQTAFQVCVIKCMQLCLIIHYTDMFHVSELHGVQ